ncbi:MAG: hypothetical protein ACI4W6_09565, partial [Acutalibacteraceae bacterium]
KVPRLDWLIGGSRIGGTYNRYFGSLGTDPQKGCLCEKIFNYSIWIEKIKIEKDNDDEEDEFQEIIKAAAYFGMNSFDNTAEEEIETKSFDFEEESLPLVKKWLEEQYAKK